MKLLKELSETLQPQQKYQLLINGQWRDGASGKTFTSINPATGEQLAVLAEADQADVDLAVKSAWQAFTAWSKTSPAERSALLLKIADLLEKETERFATLETLDNGKPIRETMNVDVPASVDHFRYFAGVIRAHSDEADVIDEDTLSIVLSEPIGVVGQIIPWNFPLLMGAWKIAPALAAGNCIVIKPSRETSISLVELARVLNEVLPAGVVNVLTGSGSTTGQYMLDHEGFSKLAFTGSTDIGYDVAKAAAEKLIPATLELGGKSANIVFEDAQMDKAVEGAAIGILFNQGQVCCAGSRLLVQRSIYDKFLEQLKAKFESVKVGDPLDPNTQMGCQINEKHMDKILSFVGIGTSQGARVLTGGERFGTEGAFVKPTAIVDCKPDMKISCEEVFGPVLAVIPFDTEEEAVKIANDSEFGLGGAVWSRDINRALRVAKSVRTGRMWVNCYNQLPAHAPFGGYKKSGIGRETHKMILEAYTQKKNIFISTSEKLTGLF
ncbi:aldehyde dehydrogenase family protein [Entomomonas asaccharolytica]|uniref:Aldehyde dehydrogenase family protein n=1 Tax=Entomomonas asaccharolytica TaxID=2785331 RepID=A0A974RX43_9GAMM|nr:aldehyde dehydrogenase family protein [Entomomonas asaccharolytica]QQP85866.1 aldehyde dehydrogenase family protein [Entomomonas asaccharolytica]